jgi:arginyl-tRNA synthetase
MEQIIKEVVVDALTKAKNAGDLTYETLPEVNLRRPPDKAHGDLASPIAMELASQEQRAPREIAERIVRHLSTEHSPVLKCEIAGPGFINFFLNQEYWYDELKSILASGEHFGSLDIGQGVKVQVEFVSTNPTGPLHVGHGRGAVVGDVVASILDFAGYAVQREYYVNDAGTQMDKLGHSTWCRYMELLGLEVPFIEDGYQGEYIYDVAREMINQYGDAFLDVPFEEALPVFKTDSCQYILKGIREDLERFNVVFDEWFSEQRLHDSNAIQQVVERLKREGAMYEEDGAIWFQATGHEDEKDRVVIRSDGRPTYFASDIAYHENKFQRGFQKVINVWGADHHGYVPRMKGVVKALGYAEDALEVILVQMVSLLRGGERISMSTRAGEFITLAELVDEVGVDATRFFFTMRRSDSQFDFDLDLAKSQSKENPVYYVQYAHARICSIFREAEKQGIQLPDTQQVDCSLLQLEEEKTLISELCYFPKIIEISAQTLEPHRLTYYVHNLAGIFHPYYNKHRVISDDLNMTYARLLLAKGIQIVLQNALRLLGVSAPERM